MSIAARFWPKVNKAEGCWLWTAYRDKRGYGRLRVNGLPAMAHRVSWELHNGPVPAGLSVCHDCPGGDNPSCVNPAHLFLGTHADNMADMVHKGRSRKDGQPGEQNAFAKLTEEQARSTFERYARGETQLEIAESLGVDVSTVGHILRGKNWPHLRDEYTAALANRGRQRKRRLPGTKNGFSKLDDKQVVEIRFRRSTGEPLKSLAAQFGVSETCVSRIARGKCWAHVA